MANFGNFIFAADTDWESTSLVIHNYNDFFSCFAASFMRSFERGIGYA